MNQIFLSGDLLTVALIFAIVRLSANTLDDLYLGSAGVLSCILILLMVPGALGTLGSIAALVKFFRLAEELFRIAAGFYRLASFIPLRYTGLLYLGALNRLVHVLRSQQRYEDALAVSNEALAFSEKRFGPRSIEATAWSIDRCGLLHELGDSEGAVTSGKRAMSNLDTSPTASKQQIQFLCMALNNLSIVLADSGHPEQANDVISESLKLKERVYGRDNPETEVAYANQGYALLKCGNFSAAEKCLRTAIEIGDRTGVQNKVLRGNELNNLGDALRGRGELVEAENYLNQSLQLRQKTLPPSHPFMAYSYNSFGKLYRDLGKVKESDAEFQKALKIREAISSKHPDVAVTLIDYAELLQKMGKAEEAEQLLQRAKKITESKSADPVQSKTKKPSRGLLSVVLIRSAITIGCMMILLPEMALSFAVSPPAEIPDGSNAARYYDLGVKYKQAGWIEKSRDCLNRAIKLDPTGKSGVLAARYLKTKVPRYPQSEAAIEANIAAYNETDKSRAKKMFAECIDKYPNFEWPYMNLGVLYLHDRNMAKAEEFLNKTLSINPNSVEAWDVLALTKQSENDIAGARKCADKALELDPDDGLARLLKVVLNKR